MSLAQITREIRTSSKIIGALVILGIIIFLFFQGGTFIQKAFFPKPAPPPEQKFGELTGITFPESTISTPEYRINTISGQLPAFSDRINVYEITTHQASITALKSAQESAAQAGYTESQTSITPSIYSWTMPETETALEMDIISRDFKIVSNFLVNPIYTTGQTLTPENAIESVTELITVLEGNTEDIDSSKTEIQNYVIESGNLVKAEGFMPAQITRVNFYQNSVNKFPIYYPVYNESVLYFLITFVSGRTAVPEASYIHKVPNLEQFSTYPLKTSTQAFEDLKNGNGYIVSQTNDEIVDITEVSLGYYIDDSLDQKYLMPIIIFSGKNDFQAYVSAISE